MLIPGKDGVAQKRKRGVFMRGKILGRIFCRDGSSLLRAHQLVYVFGRLGGNHLQYGTARRAQRQIFQNIPSRNSRAHERFPFLPSSSRYSEARQDSAMIVSVGFLSGLVTSGAPSVTKTFFTSCAWQYSFSTETLGSAPIRAVPTS